MNRLSKHIIHSIKQSLICFLTFLLVQGCGQKLKDNEKVFRIAYVMAPGGTSHAGAEKLKELIEKEKEFNIRVKLYPNAILGKDRELMEGLRLKSVDMVIGGPSIIGAYAPEYQLFEAPFLFRDYQHLKSVLHGPVGEEMEFEMAKGFGFHYLGYFMRGPRYLTTTSTVIKSPKDLNGLKLRVPELDVYIKAWETFGANPTPLAFSDMFMALRQGVVDGQENPLEVIFTNNLHEVQKYVMETKHLLSFYILAVGNHYYDKFSNREREHIQQVIDQASKYHDNQMEAFEKQYRKKIEEAGTEFIEVNRKEFEQLANDKLPKIFIGKWKKGVYNEIINSP